MDAITLDLLRDRFPYPKPRVVQEEALKKIAESTHGVLLEIPTGEGKTGIGIAALRAFSAQGRGPLFYITPTKTQVDQVVEVAGDKALKMLGRVEYPCLYYDNRGVQGVSAQESPCYMLKCKHRVNQETGGTEEEGATPCPYFQAKYDALTRSKKGGIVVCTTAFFLKNRLMVGKWREEDPALVVVDEAHRLASTARSIFEYTLTDFHLKRAVDLVKRFDRIQAKIIKRFRDMFMRIARTRNARSPSLLDDQEITRLVAILDEFDPRALLKKLEDALEKGQIDPVGQKDELKLIENLAHNIPRFVKSLEYAREEDNRRPLNYVVAFYYKKDDHEFKGTRRRARYYLTIKSYFVVPLLRMALGKRVVAYSATIGDPKIVKFETGIDLSFCAFSSGFAVGHTRIFVPMDNQNLAARAQERNALNRTLRRIVAAAKRFADAGHRSLVVVVSEAERRRFLEFAKETHLAAISYGDNGVTARAAASSFVAGKGEALVGTVGQYGEGVDLPRGIAPVIFFLRPGYQRPDDPQTQFEERRFSEGHCWALWHWRVMIEALQVRGRNIRTAHDLGVCFFMSNQFRRFLYSALPEWLKPAYRKDLVMEEAVRETLELLG